MYKPTNIIILSDGTSQRFQLLIKVKREKRQSCLVAPSRGNDAESMPINQHPGSRRWTLSSNPLTSNICEENQKFLRLHLKQGLQFWVMLEEWSEQGSFSPRILNLLLIAISLVLPKSIYLMAVVDVDLVVLAAAALPKVIDHERPFSCSFIIGTWNVAAIAAYKSHGL